MEKYKFDEKELQTGKSRVVFGCEMTEFDPPITPKENLLRALKGEPVWLPSTFDYGYLCPECVPDNVAKGNVMDARLSAAELGGKDMFGIEWEYVEQVGGSTTRPGHAPLEDVNDWKEVIHFPTKEYIDSWDWEEMKRRTEVFFRKNDFWEIIICSGYFERLISFMDFEEAAVAMIDEEQEEAIQELFEKLTDLYISLIDKFLDVLGSENVDAVCVHDDWGHQRGVFFSSELIREKILPHMQRITDYIHKKGMIAECHSCGKVDPLIPIYIEAGFDMLECQNILEFDQCVPEFGDKLLMHVSPDVPPLEAPEEEHIAAARAFVDKMLQYGNPFLMDNYYSPYPLSKTFCDEVYRYSRIKLAE
ncbi:MAG: uroporphyrinogen decarboxylase family protein [Lachnospiraceae bacterium]|nr:uroporphyrinogen decarboxylase family protein [Lachnospiraceae bacterium]